jgi:uncharacterized RDD family membrane protein YckC
MNYSGFFRRFGASFIDGLILAVPTLLIGGGGFSMTIPGSIGIGLLLQLAYYPIFESSKLNATPGKAIMGMVVLTEAGETLTFKAAVIRLVCRYLSMAICYIGYLMQPFTKKRQTLHDILSEAVVIDRETPDLNYFTVWTEQFIAVVNKL